MPTRPRLAVSLSHLDSLCPANGLAEFVRLGIAADAAGIDQIALSEHVALPAVIHGHPGAGRTGTGGAFPFPADEGYPEPLVALAALAVVTTRVRLSTNVLLAPLRPAVLLAKTAATTDCLSNGRLDLGIGIGWQREEFAALGVPFEGVGPRIEDTVGACQALWRGGPADFESPTVSFRDLHCAPTPVQGDQLPIWFGGTPSRRTARRVAQLGHGWTPIGGTTPEQVTEGRELIAEACAEIDRDPAEIDVRCSLPLGQGDDGRPDLARTIDGAAPFLDAGATVIQLPALDRLVETADAAAALFADAVAHFDHRFR